MRLLLDTCVWGGAKDDLARADHDVIWTGDWETDPGDATILAYAQQAGRILVTIDKDFGELAILKGQIHCGIIRLVGFRARDQANAVVDVLRLHGQDLVSGAIVTVEPGRLRLRPGPA